MKLKKLTIWCCILLLLLFGLIMVYSSTNIYEKQFFVRQIAWTTLCIILFKFLTKLELDFYIKNINIFYIIGIILLILVLFFGRRIQGAKSWFDFGYISFQPSELYKLVFIISISKVFVTEETQTTLLNRILSNIMNFILYIFLPIFLIYLQPDVGSIIVYILVLSALFYVHYLKESYIIPIFYLAFFSAIFLIRHIVLDNNLNINNFFNIRMMNFLTPLNVVVSLLFLTLLSILFLKKYFKLHKIIIIAFIFIMLTFTANLSAFVTYHQLRHYQIQRIIAFLDPYSDPLDFGYNTIQSLIAIGSGGLTGKGLMQGTQSRLGFLPERRTDFILSVICEETGFIGVMILMILFFTLIINMILCIYKIQNNIAQYICLGILFMLFFEIFINVSVALDLIPVMGIPLPFISYGGSSLLKYAIAFSIIHNLFKKI